MEPNNYQRFRVRHHVGAAGTDEELPAPSIDGDVFASVPNEFQDQYILDYGVKDKNVSVRVAIDPNFTTGDYFNFFINGVADFEDPGRHIEKTENDLGFITVEITPEQRKEEKEYSVFYTLMGVFDEVPTPSAPAFFKTKYTPAGNPPDGSGLGALTFTDSTVENDRTLTSAQLTGLGDELKANVPSYKNLTAGDLIRAEIVARAGGTPEKATPVRIPLNYTNAPVQVSFSRANLEAVGDGLVLFRYVIEDLAGHTSLLSEDAWLDLMIKSSQIVLEPPSVPASEQAPKIIGETIARLGVDVQIPGNDDLLVGDAILVSWGTQQMPMVLVIDPTQTPMMTVTVPYPAVLAEGTGTISVTYSVYRAGKFIGQPANPTVVEVNLDQPGGRDTDPLTPENEALGKPTVHANGWTSGKPENTITLEESRKDASFIVPWFTASTPSGNAFKKDDVLEFFYNGEKFQDYTITDNDVTKQEKITVTLPATVLQRAGSGKIDAQYVASRNIAPGLSNSAYSPKQSVAVQSSKDLPGGDDPLPYPIFADKILNTPVALAGALITVPKYINMKVNDLISITFTANWGFSGSGAAIQRAAFPQDGSVEAKRVTDEDITNGGVRFEIPSERLLYLYQTAKGHLTYIATNDYGSAKSPQTDIICDVRGLRGKAPYDPDRPEHMID